MNQANNYRQTNLETAIKNVGLLADNVWATNDLEKEYKQTNLDLWIRFKEAEELSKDFSQPNKIRNNLQTVKDRIPLSRLAKYGNFTYDKSEELFYRSCTECDYETQSILVNNTEYCEFWLQPEVEQEFRRLTCPVPTRLNVQQQNKKVSKSFTSINENKTLQPLQIAMNVKPSQWLENEPWPARLLYNYPNICDKLSSPEISIFNQDPSDLKRASAMIRYPPLRYFLDSPNEYELHMKLNAASVKEIWDTFSPAVGSSIANLLEKEPSVWKISLPLMDFNCEVPEFYPKTVVQQKWQMLPSASDPNYQIDLFPYQTLVVSAQNTVQSVAAQPVTSTLTSVTSLPPSITSSFVNSMMTTWNQPISSIPPQPIPVFQRPPEFYAQSEGVKNHRKRGGVEYSNLILLGSNSNNGSENVKRNTSVPVDGTTQTDSVSETFREPTLNSEIITPLNTQPRRTHQSLEEMNVEKVTLEQINVWLDKVYPQRSEHFSEMMSTVDTLYNIASEVNKLERVNIVTTLPGCCSGSPGSIANNSDISQMANKGAIKKVKTPNSSNSSSPPTQRRLYRDVLNGDTENRFAQLEQEALEQYQPSDHNISTVAFEENLAQRFQDLEREALEQYRGDKDDLYQGASNLSGEDNGGSGDIEEDPDPPIVKIPSRDITIHQQTMEGHQAGVKEVVLEEEEDIMVENKKNEVKKNWSRII